MTLPKAPVSDDYEIDVTSPEFQAWLNEALGPEPASALIERIGTTAAAMKTHPAVRESSDGVLDVRTKNQQKIDAIRSAKKAKSKAAEPDVVAKQGELLPAENTPQEPMQLEMFNADLIIDYTLRDEINGMSIPMYALAKKPDRGVWRWDSHDGKHYVEITSKFLAEQLEGDDPRPGEVVHGRATIFDKDIIIYSISKINEALERGLPVGATIRFTAYDFFKATKREPGGKDYENMMSTLRRLRSTNVETNVIGSDGETTKISGIIDEAEVKRGLKGELQYVEVTLARWLFAAIKNHKVLGISPKYFELTRPLERALYSIARKHVGQQAIIWPIGLQKLKDKCGAAPNSPLRNFLAEINGVIKADNIPDYQLAVEKKGKDVTVMFYPRDAKKVAKAILQKKTANQ